MKKPDVFGEYGEDRLVEGLALHGSYYTGEQISVASRSCK